MFSYVLILGGGLFSWWECGRHRLRVWCFFFPPWSYRCCRLGSNKMLSQEFVCSADSWWWKSASLFHQRDWGEIAVMYCLTGSWIFLSKTLSAFPLPISASACLIIQGEGKIGRLVFFFSILIQIQQNLFIQITVVPFLVFSLRRLNAYPNAAAILRLRKVLQYPLFCDCFRRILLKILPANKSLSSEGWIWYLEITKSLFGAKSDIQVWMILLSPK